SGTSERDNIRGSLENHGKSCLCPLTSTVRHRDWARCACLTRALRDGQSLNDEVEDPSGDVDRLDDLLASDLILNALVEQRGSACPRFVRIFAQDDPTSHLTVNLQWHLDLIVFARSGVVLRPWFE